MSDFDLFVIGAGSGGVRAARMAAGFGAKVAIAEEYRIGGTCVIRGCVPKKLFVYASHFVEDFELAKSFGWKIAGAEFSWDTLIENKNKEITRLSKTYSNNLEKAKVKIFAMRAQLVSPTEIELADGSRLSADKILIATGGAPRRPQIAGAELAITSNEAFELKKLPQRIVIIGGGYIAVEFAGIFNGLGVETVLAYRGAEILRGFDDELRANLRLALIDKGVEVRLNHQPIKITEIDIAFENGKVIETDCVMVATGRKPLTAGLGLENIGVKLKPNGAVVVDEFQQSSQSNIYAVGDVTDRIALTPVAIREGAAFARNVFNGESININYDLVASAVFSQPQLGTIGLTEAAAVELYGEVDIYSSQFRAMKLSLSRLTEKTFMKLIVEPKSEYVVGVHLLGAEAGELIQVLAIPLGMRATKKQFDAAMAVHPTSAEELVTMAKPTRRAKRN